MKCDDRCLMMSATIGELAECATCPGHPEHSTQMTQKRLKTLQAALDDLEGFEHTMAELVGVNELYMIHLKAGTKVINPGVEKRVISAMIVNNICPDCTGQLIPASGCKICRCGWSQCE